MTISLIINTYNQPGPLAKVLAGVDLQTRQPDQILIADDGSGEATKHLIDQWKDRAKIPVHHVWQPHEGFRRTVILNKAIRAATGNYIIFLDGDSVPHPDFIADHERLAERGFWVQGRRGFIKEQFVPAFEPGQTRLWLWLARGRLDGVFKSIRLPWPIIRRDTEQRGILGCNMAFWKEDLIAVNGFDETFLGWGREDSDLGARLYHLGRPRKFVHGRAIIYHLNHPPLPRDGLGDNSAKLAETLRSRKIRCEHGLTSPITPSSRANP